MPEKSSKIGRRPEPVCAAGMGLRIVMWLINTLMVSVTNGFVQERGRSGFTLATNKNKNFRSLRSLGRANARPFYGR